MGQGMGPEQTRWDECGVARNSLNHREWAAGAARRNGGAAQRRSDCGAGPRGCDPNGSPVPVTPILGTTFLKFLLASAEFWFQIMKEVLSYRNQFFQGSGIDSLRRFTCFSVSPLGIAPVDDLAEAV
jgi:hypothetical protein